ncbi:serine protease [Hoylesella timonensis]|uniref:Tetratricopeptide repeat protein n=1 Tax=Hoylesella timonensis CRIS 5C-B1 TaxID=679189 RepID=D1VX22_9BACT|nr:serine protease [Hoylesella timonensis]EFA98364.1 tetratricopeptide repeat protein [Hoylesella timonensis CRIS 5C-B1]
MMNIKNKISYLLTLLFMATFSVTYVHGQSKQVKKAAASIFSLTTFKTDGTLLASTNGVFISDNGEAISAFYPFVGADSAVVIDTNGNALPVDVIIGANELYDVCKFKVNGKTTPIKIASTPSNNGEKVWMLGYSIKNQDAKQVPIQKTELFMDKYTYYIFSSETPENMEGCPFVNAKGELIGILQHANHSEGTHAVDAHFMKDMQINNGLSLADPVLRQTTIRTQLPAKEEDALVTLMMASEQNKKNYLKYIQDFKRLFPHAVDGYAAQARQYANKKEFAKAATEMETAIQNVHKKDAAHAEYAKIIFHQQLFQPDSTYLAWSLDKALAEAQKAYEINPLPAYQHQQAQINYSKGNYQKAYDMFIALTKTNLRSGELFYEAAQAKAQLKANQAEILSLLDSAVAACPQPLTPIAAPFVLARGAAYDQAGDYKKAIMDYNRYDTLMLGRANHEFYYTRFNCNVKLRRYQQALNDIAHAAVLNRQEPTYLAEMASLQLKVNYIDDALKTAELCIGIAPNYPDIYLIKGLALIQKKQKKLGIEAFEKAKQLGDKRAQDYIDKYK